VLGVMLSKTGQHEMDVAAKKKSATFWLTVQTVNALPTIHSLYCCGVRYAHNDCQFILYDQPNRRKRHVLSIYPYNLSRPHATDHSRLDSKTLSNVHTTWKIASEHKRESLTFADDNELLLQQANVSQVLCDYLTEHKITPYAPTPRTSFNLLGLPRLLMHYVWMVVGLVIALVMLTVTYMSSTILWILYMELPTLGKNKTTLKQLSSTAQQLSLRLKQISTWPQHLMGSASPTSTTNLFHISFYNVLWLILNDLFMGVLLGWTIIHHRHDISHYVGSMVRHYTHDRAQDQIIWLMGWPSGLKLNDDLDLFLGDMFLWLLSAWNEYTKDFASHGHIYFFIVGLSGIFGASVIISILNDTLFFLTMHLHWFYVIMSRVYHLHVTVLLSLFNLLRGKKRNILRHRIDQADFSLDQLMVGTIMFTLLTFLLPTVAVYYATFAAVCTVVGFELV
jgi:hypothetical protein